MSSETTAKQATDHQQHPIGIYLKVWLLLFILSAFSYMVDIMDLQGLLRWSLIILFMLLKAGLIVSVFMHVMWERMALVTAVLITPAVLLVLIGIMLFEGYYTFGTRVEHLGQPANAERIHVADVLGEDH